MLLFIRNLLLQNNNISVSIVKIILDISLLLSQFIMNQNVYQILCMCQHYSFDEEKSLDFRGFIRNISM